MEASSQSSGKRAVLVTGGAGFIGSSLVRWLLSEGQRRVVVVDKLTYAGRLENLDGVGVDSSRTFYQADIGDREAMREILREHRPAEVFNLAAESHVDRSISTPDDFLQANVLGVFSLLEEIRAHWQDLPEKEAGEFRFLHVSTDEVYGALAGEGRFDEDSPYRPNSPYSATKAAADHLVRAWNRTYGLPAIVTNCSNNYGPFQFPEKLIPLAISRALKGESIPVYGRGENVRDWLHVEDHVRALVRAIRKGRPGETYNIGAACEIRNIDLVHRLCALLDRLSPRADGGSYASQIEFVPDRAGHDFRYSIDASKIERELEWRPGISFDEGLTATVQWYLAHPEWRS